MKIEEVSSDEATLIDESKLWKKRIEVKLVYDSMSFTRFNPNEEIYEIHIASKKQLLHEAHHLFKPCLRPRHLEEQDFVEFYRGNFARKRFSALFDLVFDEFSGCLDPFKPLKGSFSSFASDFYSQLSKSFQKYGFSNTFEDLAIEEHIHKKHGSSDHPLYLESYRFFEKHNPFTKTQFCSAVLFVVDRGIAIKHGFSFQEYYDWYLDKLKNREKEIPGKDFAEMTRVDLEIRRVKKIVKCGDWDEAERLLYNEFRASRIVEVNEVYRIALRHFKRLKL